MLHRLLLLAVVPFTASACCGGGGEDIPIESASITDWSEAGFAAVGGFVSGSATLTTTDSAGETKTGPIGFGGPVLGIVFEMHTSTDQFGDCGGASLTIPEGGVSEEELFELYSGSGVQMGLAFGFSQHELENSAGVKLDGGGVTVGMGMFVGLEWFGMSRE